MKRETAYRLPLNELVDADFFKSDEAYAAHYAITKSNYKVSRVLIWGNVLSVQEKDTQTALQLHDFTEEMKVVAFEDKKVLLAEVKGGDVVQVIGKIRQNDKENYIVIEHIKQLNAEEEAIARLENMFTLKRLKATDTQSEKPIEKKTEETSEPRLKIEKTVL
jgi:RPA family protein